MMIYSAEQILQTGRYRIVRSIAGASRWLATRLYDGAKVWGDPHVIAESPDLSVWDFDHDTAYFIAGALNAFDI